MGNQQASSAAQHSQSVLSSTVPLRRHIPLSQRGVPLAMGFYNGMLVTITKEQFIQFEKKNPIHPSAHHRTVSGQNGFTAASLTFSQFFKSEIALLATRQNKLSVFDLAELSEIYTLDVGGGSAITAVLAEKLSDTFWLGFANGTTQCWTFGESACKAKYIPIEGKEVSPVLKMDFSRTHQLLFVLHTKDPSLRVYNLLDGKSAGLLLNDRSQHDMLQEVEVYDFAVVEVLGLLVLLGSIGNVVSIYDLESLAKESRDESQGLHLKTKPALQYFARYQNLTDKVQITSLCVAKLDDVNTSEREYSLKVIKANQQNEEVILLKVILLLGLENGSVLSALLYREDSQIKVDPQQFYKPKGAVLMIGDSVDTQHKIENYVEAGFVPPVLHIKKMAYCLQNDVLLASNQGCMVNILPGVRGAVEKSELGRAPLIEQPKRLPLFSIEPTKPVQKKKPKNEDQPKKKLKLLSLGDKADQKVKKINWKGLVSSVKNIVTKKSSKEKVSQEKKEEQKEEVKEEKPLTQEEQQAQEFKVMEILSRYSKQLNYQEDEQNAEGKKKNQEENGKEESPEKQEEPKERASSEEEIELK